MSSEFISNFAAIGTFVVIGVTAIAAAVQLRHMRANNQLTGLLNVLSRVEDPVFTEWVDRAKVILQQRLPDKEFRQQVTAGSFQRENNPWLNICNSYEWVGSLIKNKLIPEDTFMDVYSNRILATWRIVEPIVALVRRNNDPSIWENLEFIVVRAREWEKKYPQGRYPVGVPRLAINDSWLAVDSQTT
ncbi:MAG: DUF4760 domain-containing protein [Candidatus Eremiobacter antarcticus]|nr:DUF4760 domain-containing protein [Candidatus Eremiobacteraeota bacterium]MBC5807464.1 DUF4760 domain-containing protein [Candidatus Eremiobacteraeota bacterium]